MHINTHIEASVPIQHGTSPTNAAEVLCRGESLAPHELSTPGLLRLDATPLAPDISQRSLSLWQTLLMVCCLTIGYHLHKSHRSPAHPAKNAPLHKHVPLITRNTTLRNHCHNRWCLVFRGEGEMHDVICYPGWPKANTAHSTRIQNAISGYGMVFCPARLISPFGDQGHNVGLISTLPDCLYFTKIKDHTENEGGNHKMSLYFNFFLKVKSL